MGRRPKVSHGIALLEGEERAKELAAMEQLIRAQIAHIRATSGQQNGPSAAQKKAKDEEEEAKGKPALMDELATKNALKEEHDDNSDTDDMPLLEDIYDTFDDDNSSLGEEEEAHEEPVEVKAPEEITDGKAALDKETTKEALYEER